MPLSPLVSSYDHLLLDLDGCVWIGQRCTPNAPAAIAELRAAGKSVAFLTNDPCRSPEDYVRKLWSLGLRASLEEVVTVGAAIQHLLAERGRGREAYVIGAPAIFRHAADAGMRIVNGTDHAAQAQLVVLAGHDDFHFSELRVATQAVLGGAAMMAAVHARRLAPDAGNRPGPRPH